MPKVKCDWDCCRHHNQETGECNNPDEIKLSTVVATSGSVKELELLNCWSFVDFEESEAEQVEGKSI